MGARLPPRCSVVLMGSGDGREHVFIAEPTGVLAEGQGLAPQPLKAHQRQLLLQVEFQADRERAAFHAR
jgi:hypothetical protein